MAGPLLSSLCTICRIQAPRYTCPRCGTRTCSLSCVKKHKTWSSCNGERDPTVFVAIDKLKTDAGIDHDYNFLTKIERSVERVERVLREDRDILPRENPEPPPHKKTRFNKGQSRGRTTVDDGLRKWDRNAIHRMRGLGIHVSSVPYGMTRSKENMSSWNRRTKTINWQVEWLFHDIKQSTTGNGQSQTKRMLHKALDETPLHVAFAEALEYDRQRQLTDYERAEEKKTLRKRQAQGQMSQDAVTGMWQECPHLMQNSANGTWNSSTNVDDLYVAKNKYRFLFPRPKTLPREPRRLVLLDPSETLVSILPGREIVEFPTIHVLPVSVTCLGEGYIIEDNDTRRTSKKRKALLSVDYESNGELSDEEEEEDGQIIELDAEADTSDDTTSSSGSDTEMSD
ncbi:putative HIT zinc finger protein [Rosellinia necatrix]|uniref:Box C/D snoRNA protein 1 n=1 Tax=Rosellinia necatrix TaxID=77044 RepID=A0A1W2TC97_ROSNE|nr:putative HIT zinc finger protein [Rosellinia necatrix]